MVQANDDALLNEQQQNIDNQNSDIQVQLNQDNNFSVAKIIFKTLCGCMLVLSLIAFMIMSLFPYASMRFFDTLGNKNATYNMAIKYINKYEGKYDINIENSVPFDSKFADCLVVSVMTSNTNFENAIHDNGVRDSKTLNKAKEFAQNSARYLSYDSMQKRSKIIADSDIKNTSYVMHPYLYNYSDYINSQNVKANFVLGQFEYLSTYLDRQSNHLDVGNFQITQNYIDINLVELATFFNALSGYIETNAEYFAIKNNAKSDVTLFKTPLYFIDESGNIQRTNTLENIKKSIVPVIQQVYLYDFSGEIKDNSKVDNQEFLLRRAYLARSIVALCNNIKNSVTEYKNTLQPQQQGEADEDLNFFDKNVFNAKVSDNNEEKIITLTDWYNGILADYKNYIKL